MPSFNFFKKKDKDISKLNNKKSGAGAGVANSTIPIVQAQDNKITIEDAVKELEKSEGRITKNLLINMEKTFEDTNLAFQHVNTIAEDLDAEVINTEEEKLDALSAEYKKYHCKSIKKRIFQHLTHSQDF